MVRSIVLSLAFLLAHLPMQNLALGASGFLDVTSEPPGVSVFIDGKRMGSTPVTGVELSPGKHTLQGAKEGFGTATQKIKIESDEILKIRIIMKRSTGRAGEEIVIGQDFGNLLVINTLSGEFLTIDGEKKGEGSEKITGLSTGIHEIGVGDFRKKIKIYKDYLLKVRVDENGIVVLNDKDVLAKEVEEEERRRKEAKERKEQKKLANASALDDLEREYEELTRECEGGYGAKWENTLRTMFSKPERVRWCLERADNIRKRYSEIKSQ